LLFYVFKGIKKYKNKMAHIYKLENWQKSFKPLHELIVQASSMDCDDGWRPWPIGMSWQYIHNFFKGEKIQIGDHQNLVVCSVSTGTDHSRRPNGINRNLIVNNLQKNGLQNVHFNHTDYFNILPTYKFVVSPEGNGIDCHRHYEALIAGCIPIMEKNELTENKYKGCPILWTTDYSEITPQYLEEKYKEMIDKEYDFTCLFLSNYDQETQKLIKQSGNFWLSRIDATRCTWYN
jgi:hypothetical protein